MPRADTHCSLFLRKSVYRQKTRDSYYRSKSQNLYLTNNDKLHCLKDSQGKAEENTKEEEHEEADTVGEEKNNFGFGLSD